MESLSKAEAQVYDRQLRVWGVEVQKRLQGARVLIIGTGGLAAEVAKNIVLAGIGFVTIVDDTLVANRQPGSFLVPSDADPQASVATTSATALTEMNPLVTVTSRKLESISGAQDIQDFDVVVLVGGTFTEQFRINKWCRTHNAKFFAARSIGGYAHFFVDLQTHDYSIKGADSVKGSFGHTINYVTLETALSAPVTHKKAHALFFTLQVCSAYEQETGSMANSKTSDGAHRTAVKILNGREWNNGSLDKDTFCSYLMASTEMPPVNAVVGGVLGNEIVKVVGKGAEPLCNFFFYSIKDGKGSIERFGV